MGICRKGVSLFFVGRGLARFTLQASFYFAFPLTRRGAPSTPKVDKSSLTPCSNGSERGLARFTLQASFHFAFPLTRRGAPCKNCTPQKVDKSTYFIFHHFAPQMNLCVVVLKNKRCRNFRHLLLRWFLRKEGDSNPRNAFGVYSLSRRASSTTPASFLLCGQR